MIAEKASDENTIAILSQDSDFLIYQYPPHVKYLSADKFSFEALFKDKNTLKTKSYSRQELARHLDSEVKKTKPDPQDFKVGHLPLFASLKGNDVIHSQDLRSIHERIMGNFYCNRQ